MKQNFYREGKGRSREKGRKQGLFVVFSAHQEIDDLLKGVRIRALAGTDIGFRNACNPGCHEVDDIGLKSGMGTLAVGKAPGEVLPKDCAQKRHQIMFSKDAEDVGMMDDVLPKTGTDLAEGVIAVAVCLI